MAPSKKQQIDKEPHGVGLLFLGLMLFVLITALVIITQELGDSGDYSLSSIPFVEDKEEGLLLSGHLTSVYIAQADTFIVPYGFPKDIFINGYSDIKEASFYRDNTTKEELHTYRLSFEESLDVVTLHIQEVLEDSGYDVRVMKGTYIVGEKKGSHFTCTLIEEDGYVKEAQIEYRKAGSKK